MCGLLSHRASSEHHASFNEKTDAPLLAAPKPVKKSWRNKSTQPTGRRLLKRLQEHVCMGLVFLRGGQWADRCWKKDKRPGREKGHGWVWSRITSGKQKAGTPARPMAFWAEHKYLCPTFWIGLFIDRANNGSQFSKHANVELVNSYRQNCLLFAFICL